MPDPVSWKVVERGWSVISSDGRELGHVDEIAGDAERDIFSGVVVSRGVLRARRSVPAEQIGEISEGTIALLLDAAAFEELSSSEAPPPSG